MDDEIMSLPDVLRAQLVQVRRCIGDVSLKLAEIEQSNTPWRLAIRTGTPYRRRLWELRKLEASVCAWLEVVA